MHRRQCRVCQGTHRARLPQHVPFQAGVIPARVRHEARGKIPPPLTGAEADADSEDRGDIRFDNPPASICWHRSIVFVTKYDVLIKPRITKSRARKQIAVQLNGFAISDLCQRFSKMAPESGVGRWNPVDPVFHHIAGEDGASVRAGPPDPARAGQNPVSLRNRHPAAKHILPARRRSRRCGWRRSPRRGPWM